MVGVNRQSNERLASVDSSLGICIIVDQIRYKSRVSAAKLDIKGLEQGATSNGFSGLLLCSIACGFFARVAFWLLEVVAFWLVWLFGF